MNDDAGPLLQHPRKEAAIQTHSREEIQFKFLLPQIIRKLKSAPAWRSRAADAVNQNIKAAKTVNGCPNNVICPGARADVRLNESFGIGARRDRPGRREHSAPAKQQSIYGGLSYPPC